MPPRITSPSAFAQPMKQLCCQLAQLSTSASRQAVRRDGPKTATSQLLDLGGGSSSGSNLLARDSTKGASDLYAAIRRPGNAAATRRRSQAESRQELEEKLKLNHQREDYLRQLSRKWATGDIYSPHDLSPSEMSKFRQASSRKQDLVDVLGLKPLDMYRNFSFIAEAITPHGRIRPALMTGLRPVNQRKLAKAVRRAVGLGLHPSVHKHPEMLLRDLQRTRKQNEATRATYGA
ncbi:ribosomal protein S18 [Microdochium bolleyi]|uniref:Small ribosomal subunit protein bS18m n=1 Tax=Microdochium bolleyi TaxID=196109 RepID=A0A136J1L1_9PEZI|nr:ribosomal protein S18 [Microdochium bolleyi]